MISKCNFAKTEKPDPENNMIKCSIKHLKTGHIYSSNFLNIKAPFELNFGFAYFKATKILSSETS